LIDTHLVKPIYYAFYLFEAPFGMQDSKNRKIGETQDYDRNPYAK
jgi:hypothetical protein